MMRHILPSVFFLFLAAFSGQAQTAAGNYTGGIRQDGNHVFFTTTHAAVKLEFCTPEMFRVRTSWSGAFAGNEPYMVVRYARAPFPPASPSSLISSRSRPQTQFPDQQTPFPDRGGELVDSPQSMVQSR
jgi:hypothetical protein